MRIASALSTLTDPATITQEIEHQLTLPRTDLLLLFISAKLTDSFQQIVTTLRKNIRPKHLLAVIGESIIGTDREIEHAPAVSALALHVPDATLHTFHLAEDQWQELLSQDELLHLHVAHPSRDDPDPPPLRAFILLADPFTTPVVQLLDAFSHRYPAAPVIGGMASGMHKQGETRLAVDDEIHTSGLVGISIAGDIQIDMLVSQGCRAVGDTFVVTKGRQNIIEQLDGKPALAAIEEMVQGLPSLDRQLLANGGLQVGRIIDQGKGSYGKGDFLIRSLIDVRRDTGAVLVGDMIRPGETLQFHIRDASAADEEMRLLLQGQTMLAEDDKQPLGALLITCNGRGTRLFDKPNHDVTLTRQILGDIPVAGFFAAGEMGPVGTRNFVHGHTAALALFRQG